MKSKIPFSEGDILLNSISDEFIYVYDSKFDKKAKTENELITYTYMRVGGDGSPLMASENIEDLSEYIIRYGNIADINMSLEDLKSISVLNGDSKEQGLRLEKLNTKLKLKFLMSY